MDREDILNLIIDHESNNKIDLRRVINEDNQFVFHYKVNNEVVFLFVELDSKNKVINKLEKRTEYKGISIYNSRSQIDGWEEVVDLDKTEINKKFIKDFYKNILLKGVSKSKSIISNYISEKEYYQHNFDNEIGDGLDQLLKSVSKMNSYGSDLKYDNLIKMIVQGNFAFLISEQFWLNSKTNESERWVYFDLFRIKNNKIVEHWDILGRENNLKFN